VAVFRHPRTRRGGSVQDPRPRPRADGDRCPGLSLR